MVGLAQENKTNWKWKLVGVRTQTDIWFAPRRYHVINSNKPQEVPETLEQKDFFILVNVSCHNMLLNFSKGLMSNPSQFKPCLFASELSRYGADLLKMSLSCPLANLRQIQGLREELCKARLSCETYLTRSKTNEFHTLGKSPVYPGGLECRRREAGRWVVLPVPNVPALSSYGCMVQGYFCPGKEWGGWGTILAPTLNWCPGLMPPYHATQQ